MRLLVVSNRLPVTAVQTEHGFTFQESVGGVASGLGGYLEKSSCDYIWIGWPGATVSEDQQQSLKSKAYSEFKAYPVFLSEAEMDKFYHGFCNKTIWGLFHYFPSYTVYESDYWVHYKQVNETFSRVVSEIVQPGDVIWIHDYHLMLLPRLLRDLIPDIPIGFFLHIPFPSFEIFRLLPSQWRREILEGLLGSDLIGFHTHDYAQYFLRCVLRLLGHEHGMGEVFLRDRVVKVETFPMGIDFQKYHDAASSLEAKKERDELKKTLGNAKIILSVNRLDYSKGIIKRLDGYEAFLQKNPDWHGKVSMVLVVVPSRVAVEHYELVKRQIDERVGRINGSFANIEWNPISYLYKPFSLYPLVGLYSASDVMLVTPLRDGMNLIAKEYIAARTDRTGVLILSEMAGASKELGEAVIINPNTVDEIAGALKEALEMPRDEQIRRNQLMQWRLQRYDLVRWANDFIQSLLAFQEVQKRFRARFSSVQTRKQICADFKRADHRMLVFDYDGTLVPYAGRPEKALPDTVLRSTLQQLAGDPRNTVVLISGRDKTTMENWFGDLPIRLIAEHGAWIRQQNLDWQLMQSQATEWKLQILPILEVYADRLPGSLIEEKEFSVVYHYRAADPELATIRVRELMDNLAHLTANLQILNGSKTVEIRNAGSNKGTAVLHLLASNIPEFILAIGDDWTDEDIFRILPKTAYSIKVGLSASHARYNLRDPQEVLQLLDQLLDQ